MAAEANSAVSWGPAGQPAAVSITFDNVGEAMELAMGTWPEDKPIGSHYSVTEVLPKVLDLLAEEGVHCTYFVEGWSADLYPETVQRLREAGHEIGYHGWRHEHWANVASREREADLLARGVDTMHKLGIELRGFRPPGGILTPWTLDLLRDNGFSYLSPAARRAGLLDGLAALPFQWRAIDAYYFFDAFAPLRRQFGDPEDVLPPSRLVAEFKRALEETIATRGYLALLFHPFLQNDAERFDAMREIVRIVASSDDIWSAPCSTHADWVLTHGETYGVDPELDARSWQ